MSESGREERSGSARWLTVHDELLRGLTHALSNRVGTIAAASYLLESLPADAPAGLPAIGATLREESDRLDRQLQVLRLLPRRSHAVHEPLIPTDAVTQASALHQFHPDHGDVEVMTTLDGDLQPAYADPINTVLALTVMLGVAGRAAGRHGRIALGIACDTELVHVTAEGVQADGSMGRVDGDIEADLAAARWLLAGCGARATSHGIMMSLPTLQSSRRA